jgi:hypothetical protein
MIDSGPLGGHFRPRFIDTIADRFLRLDLDT